MKLYIDTSSSERIIIMLGEKQFETDSKRDRSQALLPFIVETLRLEGIGLKHISEVEVNTGPGSFTGLRVGASVGNALAWALKVPGYFTQLNYSK